MQGPSQLFSWNHDFIWYEPNKATKDSQDVISEDKDTSFSFSQFDREIYNYDEDLDNEAPLEPFSEGNYDNGQT